MFLSSGIHATKGAVEQYQTQLTKAELHGELGRELLDGFNEDERQLAKLKLKQVERLLLLKNNRSREIVSKVEGEIVVKMKDNISDNREKLKGIQATQLDIANVILEQKVFQREMLNSLSVLEKKAGHKGKQQLLTGSVGVVGAVVNHAESSSRNDENVELLYNRIKTMEHRLNDMEKSNKKILDTQRKLEMLIDSIL